LNLTSKKARVPIALGTAALVAGGGLLASPAFGAEGLNLNPGNTTVNVPNMAASAALSDTAGHYNLAQSVSNATYAVRVTNSVSALRLQFDSYTPPTGVVVANPFMYYAEQLPGSQTGPAPVATDTTPANGTPDDGPWMQLDADNVTPPTATLTGNSSTPTREVYVAADSPGTYKFHFVDPGSQGGTDDDTWSPTITLNVRDASAATGATTDDWQPAVSNNAASAGIGAPITGAVAFGSATTNDARGSSSGTPVLAQQLAKLVAISFAGAGVAGDPPTVATLSGSSAVRTLPTGATTGAGTLTTTATFNTNGDGTLTDYTLGTATTTVASNNVTALTLAGKDVAGSVKQTGNAVAVKTGTAAVTYTATVTATPASDIANKVVYFTINGDAPNIAKLSTNGTPVDVAGTTSKIYSAVTDANGHASITVTSSDPKAADTYTVDADSNGHDNGADLTTTYANAAAATFTVTNDISDLYPAVGTTSVTIKGKLWDQFGASFKPASADVQQVGVGIDVNDGDGAWDANTITANSTVIASDGTFQYTYTPSPAPTAGQVDVARFTYTGATPLETKIQWASPSTATSVTLTTPTDNATGANLSKWNDVTPGQSSGTTGATGGADADDFGDANGQVTGVVRDAGNATIAFKKVTITGSEGVYFSTSSTGTSMKTSIDVASNASGVFSGVYAFFTKAGSNKVTATADSASKEATVTTDALDPSNDAFTIIAIDAEGTPGTTLVVTGKVTDYFGRPVPGATVDLSTGASTIGTLANTTPTTNSEGVWSTTFVSGSNQSGEVTLTATLSGQTSNRTPSAFWSSEAGANLQGLPEHGEHTDQATITIKEDMVTLEATAVVVGGGRAFVSGTAKPNSNVDIMIRPVGSAEFTLYDVVRADAEGEFGTSKNIARSTQWLARQRGISSSIELSSVQSKVTIGLRALGGGRAVLAADGQPNATTNLRFYRVLDNGKLAGIKTVRTNKAGYGSYIWKTTKGAKKIRVYYAAPGTRAGWAERIVVVK
jgi:hypothetical protein